MIIWLINVFIERELKMRRLILFLFIIIFIMPFVFCSKLIVGSDQGYPPFEFKHGNSITGFNVELMREIAKLEKLDIEMTAGPWSEIREAFENHEIDVLTGFYYYPSRTEYTTFTHPHGYIIYSIFTQNNSTIKSKEELPGKTIIVQKGDVMVDYLQREQIEAEILSYESPELVLSALSEGMGDCALIGQKQGQYLIQEKNIKGIRFINEPLLTIPYCFAVQKGNHELELKLNEGLRKLHLSGRYSEIYNEWFGSSKNRVLSLIITILLIVGAVVFVFLVLFYVWNTKLKELVAKKTETIKAANRIIEKNYNNLKIQNRKLADNEKKLFNANLEAESAIRLKNEFLTNISHELRTPLNGIMGMVLLLNKTQPNQEQQEYIDMLSVSSKQLLKIINQLLDYSVLVQGKLRLEKKPIDFRKFIDETLIPLKQSAFTKKLNFSYQIDSKLPETVWMDENKIRHALMNLVSNGIKYTKKGSVTVDFDKVMIKEENYLRVTIKDTGIGIPFSNLNDIFNSFYQIDGSYSREYAGTGLGLSIAKKSIEMHKGWIEVESELEKGSTFRFFIPLKNST